MDQSAAKTLSDAERAREMAEALLGPGVCEQTGVTQISAGVRQRDGRLQVLRIGQTETPRSEHDFFALSLCRARADAVLTSGENLRREPELSHALTGPHARALRALRESAHKTEPLRCAILSRSGDLPLDHPVWEDGTTKLVFTAPEHEAQVRFRLAQRARVVGLPDLHPRRVIAWLKQEGAQTVSVEAGPRTLAQLYEGPRVIDELILSRYGENHVPESVLGAALPEDSRLFAGLSCLHEATIQETNGTWIFQRWARAPLSAH
jgi:riboflavin biosynthesis pyrimidine reductase